MQKISTVYTTLPTSNEAELLASLAVESRLAACVNIIPTMTSMYIWEDKIEKQSEIILIFKSSTQNVNDLVALIKDNHPYSVPAILVTDVQTTADFFDYIQAQSMKKAVPTEQHTLLSHTLLSENLGDVIHKISNRIKQHGDTPDVTVNTQLEIVEQLSQFEFGRFLLINQGINGYWTHYMLTYPWVKRDVQIMPTSLEQFLLEKAPTILATQQRFEIFLRENQQEVINGAKLACIPSGMMGELLYLNFEAIDSIKLIGIDYDSNALEDAKSLAKQRDLLPVIELHQADAWNMSFHNEFDLISSNGLTIYEPDDKKVTLLYQKFYHALKAGGKLVTSFLTPPPGFSDTTECEWDMKAINQDDLIKQKIIFADVIEAKWQCFRTSAQTKDQLESVGFECIEFIYDSAKLFPTVIARKKPT